MTSSTPMALASISPHIVFSTVSTVKNRKIKKIEDEIKQVNKLYLQRDFKITCIHADSNFEPICA